jgi:hypothetical protein
MKHDVVILYHPKDAKVFPLSISGVRKNLDVQDVRIITRESERELVESQGAVFHDENEVIPGLTFQSVDHPRWGWYLQQIMKLAAADFVGTDHYLLVDADTIFLRKVPMFRNGKPLYATSREYNAPYFRTFEEMLGFPAEREFSFITHHMMWSRDIVRELRGAFRGNGAWWEKISAYVEPRPPEMSNAQFSEFETYGHYLKAKHPDELRIRKLRWRNMAGDPTPDVLAQLARKYDFCSFHSHGIADPTFPQRVVRGVKNRLRRLVA